MKEDGRVLHRIIEVKPRSLAMRHGIRSGDMIETINGEALIDDIDYQALTMRPRVTLGLVNEQGEKRKVTIIKSPQAPLGLCLDETIALKPRVCRNKCVFCFIDQMPKGMRKTLYVKDDDWRLSLMMGNFVTLTNVDDAEFERILRRKASPLYISVHATNPNIRAQMMGNPNARSIMDRLTRLQQGGIHFHCQIVLCPSLNDGDVLDDTLQTLSSLYPAAQSAALVPVGLTKCREGLVQLQNYDALGAQKVLEQAAKWQEKLLKEIGTRFVFPSDEFYCKAGEPLPQEEAYEGFPQIENGVGLLKKFENALAERAEIGRERAETGEKRRVLLACGTSVAKTMRGWVERFAPKGPVVKVQPIINHFFGETVTVTGLLTGGDLKEQLAGVQTDEILLCANTLRNEGDLFLDDMPLTALKEALFPAKITIVPNIGAALYEALLGHQPAQEGEGNGEC